MSEQLPPPGYQPRPVNALRIVSIVVGGLVLFVGIGALALPAIAGAVGERINPGLAFLLAGAADLLLAGVYVAGILVARRARNGHLRAVPPAVACVVLIVGFIVAYPVIRALASW